MHELHMRYEKSHEMNTWKKTWNQHCRRKIFALYKYIDIYFKIKRCSLKVRGKSITFVACHIYFLDIWFRHTEIVIQRVYGHCQIVIPQLGTEVRRYSSVRIARSPFGLYTPEIAAQWIRSWFDNEQIIRPFAIHSFDGFENCPAIPCNRIWSILETFAFDNFP